MFCIRNISHKYECIRNFIGNFSFGWTVPLRNCLLKGHLLPYSKKYTDSHALINAIKIADKAKAHVNGQAWNLNPAYVNTKLFQTQSCPDLTGALSLRCHVLLGSHQHSCSFQLTWQCFVANRIINTGIYRIQWLNIITSPLLSSLNSFLRPGVSAWLDKHNGLSCQDSAGWWAGGGEGGDIQLQWTLHAGTRGYPPTRRWQLWEGGIVGESHNYHHSIDTESHCESSQWSHDEMFLNLDSDQMDAAHEINTSTRPPHILLQQWCLRMHSATVCLNR